MLKIIVGPINKIMQVKKKINRIFKTTKFFFLL